MKVSAPGVKTKSESVAEGSMQRAMTAAAASREVILPDAFLF